MSRRLRTRTRVREEEEAPTIAKCMKLWLQVAIVLVLLKILGALRGRLILFRMLKASSGRTLTKML